MAEHDIVVIGASSGGLEALKEIVGRLPEDFPAAVFIVVHVSSESPSHLPEILGRAGKLKAVHPRDGDRIERGTIYVAPPDFHLMVHPGRIRLVRGPRENRHRPAIDPLFRSAARVYGGRTVGVILSGSLDDGSSGLYTVKKRGGIAIAQEPRDAQYAAMPRNAIENARPDYILPAREIGAKLMSLAGQPAASNGSGKVSKYLDAETKIAEFDMQEIENGDRPGKPSPFSCPDCHGVLWEVDEDDAMMRFRCRVGHAYTAANLAAEQEECLEGALWQALRALEESAAFSRRMAEMAKARRHKLSAVRHAEQAESKEEHSAMLRKMLLATEKVAEELST